MLQPSPPEQTPTHPPHSPPSPLQVVLLDPVLYPGALKVFAREVCKNDMLSFGRMHLFFPDSRLSLDLNTDKTLKAGLKRTHAWGSACRLRCHVVGWPHFGKHRSSQLPHTHLHPLPTGGAV